MNPIAQALWIAKGVGWDNVPRRLAQSLAVRSGWLRRKLAPERFQWASFPCKNVAADLRLQQWQQRRARFFPTPKSHQLRELVSPQQWQDSVTEVCSRAIAGDYLFFSHSYEELGWPPNFNLDPVNGIHWPIGEHCLDSTRSGPPRNDIKLVWETSRCSLAFYLARQYQYSQESIWAERLWEFIEAWVDQNPVNQTVAWGCGQETAFRLMALLTATLAILDSPATSAKRLALLELLCWQSARRIDANINYAISQENNHAISEAVGLWTVGLLFPEFPESDRWRRRGQRVLESEVLRQVYDDGSYVQHSMSYHRVMLDDLCWAIQLGRINGEQLSQGLIERVGQATEWLGQFVNRDNGRVPNYGTNDGANVLPLSCCDYLDYRPTLQAAEEICGIGTDLDVGVWSEKCLWLSGRLPMAFCELRPGHHGCQEIALSGPLLGDVPASGEELRIISDRRPAFREQWQAEVGGYYVMHGPNSLLMTRAARYRDRPGQCDQLHIDLWIAGINLLRDAGSFRYYHEDPYIKNYFYSVSAHNTVQVGTTEQMTKGPNFLWFHWPQAAAAFVDGELQCRATFTSGTGYTHKRRIRRDGDSYTIVDSLESGDGFTARLRLAPELTWQPVDALSICAVLPRIGRVRLQFESSSTAPIELNLTRAWESLYYGVKSDCPAVEVTNPGGELTTRILFSDDCN